MSPEEMRRLATSFNAMAREVQASRQAQRDFVANVSHDLKTPLTSIQGFSQAILDGTASNEDSRQRAAQVIHEEADLMAHLVDSLLDLARIFERFYRGDKSRGKTGKAAGLGLAIAREIIHAHGGEIRAESVVGLGTRFTAPAPAHDGQPLRP